MARAESVVRKFRDRQSPCSAAFAPSRNAAACASGSDDHGLSSGTRRAAVCGAGSRGTLTDWVTQSRSRRTTPALRRGVQIIRSSSGTRRVGLSARDAVQLRRQGLCLHTRRLVRRPTCRWTTSSRSIPLTTERSSRGGGEMSARGAAFPVPVSLAPSPEKPLIRRERQSIAPRTLFPPTRERESRSRSRRPGVACRAHENRPDRRTGADTLQTERTRR
jgi:hypothetical protein